MHGVRNGEETGEREERVRLKTNGKGCMLKKCLFFAIIIRGIRLKPDYKNKNKTMIFRKNFLIPLIAVFLLGLFNFGPFVFAEGDTVCSGRITGVTPLGNPNGGETSFNAHPGSDEAVSLSIVGLVSGLAPGNRGDAACVSKESGTFDGQDYEYAVKGWAWNTNGGFVSFGCQNGVNNAGGDDVACGNIDYGVYISPDIGGGARELFGYAWSPTYGWIQFDGSGGGIGAVSGPHNLGLSGSVPIQGYTVTYVAKAVLGGGILYVINIDGEAASIFVPGGNTFPKTYVFANGVKFTLLSGAISFNLETPPASGPFDYGVEIDGNGDSSGYAWTQSRIYLDFSDLNFKLPGAEVVIDPGKKWCDGKPFLCTEVEPDPADLKFGSGAADAVKLADGNDGYYLHLYFKDASASPVDPDLSSDFVNGIIFNWKDTVKMDQVSGGVLGDGLKDIVSPWQNDVGSVTFKPLTMADFMQATKNGQKDIGHFVSKSKISSYAPTSESKLSPTTSTKPVYYVNNEEFFYMPQGVNLPAEKNQLILKNITYPDWIDGAGKLLLKGGVIYPNGKVDMPFKFKPAVVTSPLYANDLQDALLAYRSVPVNLKVGVKILGNLLNDGGFEDGIVDFNLAYSKEETNLQADCSGQDVKKDFVFKFLKDLHGGDLSNKQKSVISSALQVLNGAGEVDVQAIAEIPDYNSDDPSQLPCAVAKGANLYTKVAYKVSGKTIQYYDDKLPRVAGGAVLNPVAIVHGNIFAQASGTVRKDERVQTSGAVNVNIIRDAIDENLENYSSKSSVNNLGKGDCNLIDFKDQFNGFVYSPGTCAALLTFDVGKEHVLYFKGSNVTLDLVGNNWSGKWVIVNDGGNIFIKNNVKSVKNGASLSLVVFRAQKDADYFKTGNVYIAPCLEDVTNIEATIVADGSVFSYDGNAADIDAATGEPKWASYSDMVKSLNCQLFFKGAIYSDNTIGGANLDQGISPKNYLLAGGGKVIKLPASLQDRMKAQYYDLNYLRMFRLDLELTPEGLPIDQKCGKGWTAEDQQKLLSGAVVCGEKKPCNPNGNMNQVNICDGINPLLKYDAQNTNGDLIVPKGVLKLAEGLDPNKDFEPVYVYSVQPDKGSFVFSKKGAVSVGGK